MDSESATMGDCVQVSGAASFDGARKHRGAGGADWRAHARSAPEASEFERRDGVARDAAQRG